MPLKLAKRVTLDVSEQANQDIILEGSFLGALYIQAAADSNVTVFVEKNGGTVLFYDTLDVSVQDSHWISFSGGLDVKQSASSEERTRMRQELGLGYGVKINVQASADADIFVYEWYR